MRATGKPRRLDLVRRAARAPSRGRRPSSGSPSGETREQIDPLRPSTGPRISTPNAASLARTSSPASSAPVFPMKRAGAPSSAAQAATFAACPPGPTRISASVSPPAAIGPASRTMTSSVRSPSVQTSIATVIVRSGPWTAASGAAGCEPSSSEGSSARRPRSRRSIGAGALNDVAADRAGSRPSRARRATSSCSSSEQR